ncbi:MAG: hypothetical protein ACPG66_00390 [Flavobacteriales bacterium]
MEQPRDPQSSVTYKTARAAEVFWLVASVATTAYVGYLWLTEDLTRWTLGLFPCIAWLWFGVRRTFRLRMERPQ